MILIINLKLNKLVDRKYISNNIINGANVQKIGIGSGVSGVNGVNGLNVS
jgi:hypothetical protein